MGQRRMHLALLVFAVVSPLRATLLDFEAPLPGGLVPNASFSQGAALSATAQLTDQYDSVGVLFSTANGANYAGLITLGSGHAVSGTNGIGAVNSSGDIDYTQDLDIFLVVPGTLTPAVTDSISIQGDEISIPGNVIFTAYDLLGNVVATNTLPDTPGGTYALTGTGIHEFRLHSESGTVAYDNLQFDTPTGQSTATPEPSTCGLISIGLIAGLASRKSRNR